mgnify:CR=1 FL=1
MPVRAPALSAVVPCHNEEANLEALVMQLGDALSKSCSEWEMILIDDGSHDGTWAAVETLASADSRVRGLRLSRNFGKEAAMLAGLRAAQGAAVVLMDGDLQHPPALVPQMYEVLHSERVDQVVARRTRDGDPAFRRLFSRAYYRLVRALVTVELQDGVGDFRMISRRALDALLQLTERNRFSKGLFAWIGFPVLVIDYQNVRRSGGRSSWKLKSLLDYGIDGLISFSSRPLRAGIHAGLLGAGVSVAYLCWVVAQWLMQGTTTPGYVTTLAVLVLLGSAQLTFLGIVGEYIGRIHSEVKQRPVYIVADDTAHALSAVAVSPVRDRQPSS